MLWRRALVAFAVSLQGMGAAACSKTPAEPPTGGRAASGEDAPVVPAVKGASLTLPEGRPVVVDAGGEPSGARCVRPLPAEPPPKAAPATTCPAEPAPMTFGSGTVAFLSATSGLGSIAVEIASKPEQTARGLMYRRSLPADRGMLFDLRVRRPQSFWMRNTCVPLDMMFIDEDGLIVGIVEEVPVMNDEERGVDCPSRYVLEVNAGFSRRHGVLPGQKVKLP